MVDPNGRALPDRARWDLSRLINSVGRRDVVAAVVFGSTARGDNDERSDLDILIVVTEPDAERVMLDAIVRGPSPVISPVVFTVDGLLHEAAMRPSFIAHILDEGLTVMSASQWDRLLPKLRRAAADRDALAREVRRRVRAVETYRDPERFESSPVTVLSHLYAIARSVVIARLLQQGVHEYNWHRIFDTYADLEPQYRSEIEALKNLRPYYDYARSRRGARMPEGAVPNDVRELVASIRQLAG